MPLSWRYYVSFFFFFFDLLPPKQCSLCRQAQAWGKWLHIWDKNWMVVFDAPPFLRIDVKQRGAALSWTTAACCVCREAPLFNGKSLFVLYVCKVEQWHLNKSCFSYIFTKRTVAHSSASLSWRGCLLCFIYFCLFSLSIGRKKNYILCWNEMKWNEQWMM